MNATEIVGVMPDDNQEPPKHLEYVTVSAEGIKTIYYGGEIIQADNARLTDAERAEIRCAEPSVTVPPRPMYLCVRQD